MIAGSAETAPEFIFAHQRIGNGIKGTACKVVAPVMLMQITLIVRLCEPADIHAARLARKADHILAQRHNVIMPLVFAPEQQIAFSVVVSKDGRIIRERIAELFRD